jgi:hypothetical protein
MNKCMSAESVLFTDSMRSYSAPFTVATAMLFLVSGFTV